jgi:GH15 family glucan-1,4-alpha-glucosidase
MFWDERLPQLGDLDLYRSLVPIADEAARRALEPDAGIWEYRGTQRLHTYSAAMCWAAVHRMWLIARRLGQTSDAARWQASSEQLSEVIIRRALTADGWISGVLDAPVLDAATLLIPELGLLPASDPVFVRTVEAVGEGLMNNGFIMRYKHPDDFGLPETAFLACTYWYIGALASIGRLAEAQSLFTNLLAHRNHVGLLSEDIAPTDGVLWGNFPQTYSQVGLILAAVRLSRSWTEGPWRV